MSEDDLETLIGHAMASSWAEQEPGEETVYLAIQWFCEEIRILGIFTSLSAAKTACGPSSLPWTETDGEWSREAEWGPEANYPWPGDSQQKPNITKPLLRWPSEVVPYVLDTQAEKPVGNPDPG